MVLSSFGCAIGFVSGTARKVAMASPKHSPYFSRSPLGRVIFRQMFSVNSVLQIVRAVIFVDFFLNLGLY